MSQTLFTQILQAVDGQNATNSTTVQFVVTDVNESPQCANGSHNLTLDLVTSVGAVLYALPCTDNDVNLTFSSLTYDELTTSGSGRS